MVLINTVTYQGYPCGSVSFTRTDGLAPNIGFVELNMKQVKELIIKMNEPMSWRSVNGAEADGMASIDATLKFLREGGTVAESAFGGPPERTGPAKGLNQFGDLVFKTTDTISDFTDEHTYKDIHIAPAAIEELNDRFARQKFHSDGPLRVPITDNRIFFGDYGGFIGEINVRLPDREWKLATVLRNILGEFQRPYLFGEVMSFLFAQLPTTPSVFFSAKLGLLDPPTNIIGRGEPASQHIERILKEKGLTVAMMPNGNFLIKPKSSDALKYAHIPTEIGRSKAGTKQHAEKQSAKVAYRPDLVMVVGQPRVRRRTLLYVPVVQDLDGQYYQLEEIAARWTYSVQSIKIGAMISGEKQFEDVSPQPPFATALDYATHELRRKSLIKHAFKTYAPASAFDTPNSAMIIPNQGEAQFLPILDVPIYETELVGLGVKRPDEDALQKGDLGPYVILSPLVYGKRFGQRFFADFSDVEAFFNSLKDSLRGSIEVTRDEIRRIKKNFDEQFAPLIRKASRSFGDAYQRDFAIKNYVTRTGVDPKIIQIDQDIKDLVGFGGDGLTEIEGTHLFFEEEMTNNTFAALSVAKTAVAEIKIANDWILQNQLELNDIETHFTRFKKRYKDLGGLPLFVNIPDSLISEGYALNVDSGLITFSQVMGHMRKSFVFDRESGIKDRIFGVETDGNIRVLCGYVTKTNSVYDYTTVLIRARVDTKAGSKKNGPGRAIKSEKVTPVVVGISRPSPVKARIIPAPDMVLYESENGTPFNMTSVITEALGKADQMFNIPKSSTGYVYTWSGFRKAILDAGVNSITHQWNKNGAAHTIIAANSVSAFGLIGNNSTGIRLAPSLSELIDFSSIGSVLGTED